MGPKYNQKFRREWLNHEKLKTWVAQDETKAYCKYCRCSLSGKLYDLLSHTETKKHKSSSSLRGSCWRKLEFSPNANIVDNVKMQEAALSLFVCQHTSNNTVDHLSEICKNNFEDANKIRVHRTKCTAIIKNVLAPHFITELRNDISTSKYSILVDESTDVGVIKLLGIVIIYFSTEKQKVVSTFLSLTEVHDSTAVGITQAILGVLKNYNLEFQNLLGIGTDNANVMVGNKRSVYTELKKIIPNIILIRCVCHSVQLAVTHSWKQSMPSSLEYLINETYNWFSRSYIRQQSYKHIFEAINDGEKTSTCGSVSNDYTYQNTLGRRSTLGAYYHMNNQPSYSNDHSINNQYGYNTWGIWRDGRNLAPSTFSAKPHAHYQKTRSFSIILTTAAFIVLLAVISIAGLAFYFSSIKGNMEDPVLGFEGSFRIAKGDLFSTGLKYNHTTSYKQKIEFYKRFVERALTDQGLQPIRSDVWGFGEGPLIKVNFRTFFDVRKLPQNIHNVEEFIKEAIFLETTAVKSLYRSLRIDADSVEIKRILDEQVVKSASLFKDAHTVPTSQTQLEKRLMKKTGNPPALINKPSSSSPSKGRAPSKTHSADDEPDVDVENAPVIQGSFEGSFEITKTDADIALKKTTPTRGHTMGTLAPKSVTPYALRVKPKKPGIEKLTTVVPQQQTVTSTRATTRTPTTTTTTTTTTTATPKPTTTTRRTTTTTTTTTTTPKPTTTSTTTTTTTTPATTTSTSTSTTTTTTAKPKTTTTLATSTTAVSPPSLPTVVHLNHQNYPVYTSSSSPSHSLPKLDQSLFTSVPVLDTQPWRPIHREVPEFLAGPPPSFPTKTLPTLQMPTMSTSLPLMPPVGPVVKEEPPRRRIDEIELPFLPEEPRPPMPILDTFNTGKPAMDNYKPNFYGPGFRKPDTSMEMQNSQELMFYHSFGNPVFMPGSEGIERLGAGASVQPHPLPVPLIDDVVIPPFKPLNAGLGNKEHVHFNMAANSEKFEHLGDGVIAKKQENITVVTEKPAIILETITKEELLDLNKETNNESSTTLRPKDDLIDSSSATSELADKIGEFFMDLLDLPKDEVAKNKQQPLESRIEAEEEASELNDEEEQVKETTLRFVADESTESTTAEVLSTEELSTTGSTSSSSSSTSSTTSKPNFLNLKELILQRNQLNNQNLKKSSSEMYRNTSRATSTSTSTTTTTTTTPRSTVKITYRPSTTTTKRYRVKPSQSKPPTMMDDSNLFPSHSKWEFVNNSAGSQVGHTGNMRKVFNTTLQAWVSEDVEKTENFTLNDLKTKINNATNIQDISLIFDTLASKLGITPSAGTKVPPFSYNKLKQTQNNEFRAKPSTSTTRATTTPRTTTQASTTTTKMDTTTNTTPSTTPTPYGDLVFERREPFIKPMSSFIDDSSAEGVGAAIPVVGEAEVEVIDPTKYEEMLRSSQFADSTTTETTPKLVTLLPVRSNSGIRTYKPFTESARSNSDTVSTTSSVSSATSTSSSSPAYEVAPSPAVSVSVKSSSSSTTSTAARRKSGVGVGKTNSTSSRAGITRRKNGNQSRRFPPPEAVIRGGLKVTVK